jgi:hypothetical protein
LPREIRVLSLEHVEDVVPALDGRDNPDRARWITLRGSGGDLASPGSVPGRGFAGHDLAAYRRTAERVDRAGPQLLDTWLEGVDTFTEPGSDVRGRLVRGVR